MQNTFLCPMMSVAKREWFSEADQTSLSNCVRRRGERCPVHVKLDFGEALAWAGPFHWWHATGYPVWAAANNPGLRGSVCWYRGGFSGGVARPPSLKNSHSKLN
jgi:hypothetical protein